MDGCLNRQNGTYGATQQLAELTLYHSHGLLSQFGSKRHLSTTPVRHLTCNPAFLELTGLKGDILGRTVLDLIPDNEDAWIETYADVIKTGKAITFDRYSAPLGKHFHVTAYRHAPNRFATLFTDITERIEQETQIKKQQHYLEKSQELGKIGAWEIDLSDNSRSWADESCRIFGVPAGTQSTYELFMSKVHPEDREYARQAWLDAKQGKSYDVEHRLLVDGEIRWVREKADVEFDGYGKAIKAIGFTQDITEQKRVRDELSSTLAEFRTLTESSPTAIYRTDNKGNCAYVNRRWLEIAGMKQEEALGTGWVQAIHPDDRDELFRQWKEFVKNDQEQWSHKYRFVDKDGGETTVLGTASPIHDADGKVVGYIGSNLDVTERVKWEERLEDVARFPEENKAPVIRFSDEGVVLYCNPAGMVLLQCDCWGAELGQMTPRENFREIRGIYETGRPTLISKECQGRHYDIEVIPVPERHYVNLYCRDITDQAAAEAALREAHKRSVEQARLSALGQMASGIAHDFNNALMPIIGFTDLLLAKPEQYLKEKDEMVSMLSQILEAAGDARQIVQRLRLVHRQDTGEDKQDLNINKIIESSVQLTQPRWKEQKSAEGCPIQLNTTLAKTSRPILGNESELREMMMNLIMNAVDAMPKGGSLGINTVSQPGYMQLEIIDSGEGMSEETLAKCFEPFYTTKGEHGTGLGLAMVHGIVERHNGTIEIKSRLGEGTRITIMLPYAISDAGKASGKKDTKSEAASPLRILVVDDDARALQLTSTLLVRDKHHVTSLSLGREALAVLAERGSDFDVVISDRAMPEVNGDEILRSAKTSNPEIITVLLTGFGDIMQEEGEMPEATDKVLGKPITLNDLRAAINELIANKSS